MAPPRRISDILGAATPNKGKPNAPAAGRAPASSQAPGSTPSQAPRQVPRQGIPGPAAPTPGSPVTAAATTPLPAPSSNPMSAAELRSILDDMSQVLVRTFGLITEQAQAVDRLTAVADAAGTSAAAAHHTGEALLAELVPTLHAVHGTMGQLMRTTSATAAHETHANEYGRLKGQVLDLTRDLRSAQERASRWKSRMLGAALLLALALPFLLPRLAAPHPTGCWLLGGEWRASSNACLLQRPAHLPG